MKNETDNLASIHFDVLWKTVQTVLKHRADATWQHFGDSDPGVAMLQALVYSLSDVAYRHLHDLDDILAQPAAGVGADAALPLSITGVEALATAPVSVEDIRRFILDDLIESSGRQYVPCRDVVVTRDLLADRLDIELIPESVTPNVMAGAALDEDGKQALINRVASRLSAHRALGSRRPRIKVADVVAVSVPVKFDAQVHGGTLAPVFARVFDQLDKLVHARPAIDATHASTAAEGAALQAAVPEILLHPKKFVPALQEIEGVGSIYAMDASGTPPDPEAGRYLSLYEAYLGGAQRADRFAAGDGWVRWCGITIQYEQVDPTLSDEAIIDAILALRTPRKSTVSDAEVGAAPTRRPRDLVSRPETWKRLPPAFGLSDANISDPDVGAARAFLAAFDDHLFDVCVRLSQMNPRLAVAALSAVAASAQDDSGVQFTPLAPRKAVEEADLAKGVYDRGAVQAHLLRYFGIEPSLATQSSIGLYRADAVARSDRFIADLMEIGRNRVIADGTFPALQREVAHALGLYWSVFSESPGSKAPFHMLDLSHLIPLTVVSDAPVSLTDVEANVADGKVAGRFSAALTTELEAGAVVDVSMPSIRHGVWPGVVTRLHTQGAARKVEIQLAGDADAWKQFLGGAGSNTAVSLVPHEGVSPHFPLTAVTSSDRGWRATARLSGLFPWARPGLDVNVHFLSYEKDDVAKGTVESLDADGDMTVVFDAISGLSDSSDKHRLFMTVPSLYKERATAARQLAFVFPRPDGVSVAEATAWRQEVHQVLTRLVPTHLSFETYWLGTGSFGAFDQKYRDWRAEDRDSEGAPGLGAVGMLETLGIAHIVRPKKGIGTLHVRKTDESSSALGDPLANWIFHLAA